MIVAGIDPGTALTGYAFLQVNGNHYEPIDYGCIRTKAKTPLPKRIEKIYSLSSELLDCYHPDVIALERLFFNTNVTTAMAVGNASGVIILAAAEREIPLEMYTPLQVKMALVGYGRAKKQQVQSMVKNLLNLSSPPKPDDAADALAIAICHAHSSGLKEKLKNK